MACTNSLSQVGRQVVEAMCLLPQPTTTAILATVLGGATTPEDLEPTLCHLAARALVFRSGETMRLHPELANLRHPANLGPPAATLLTAQQFGALQAIAHQLGVAPGRSKAETVTAVAEALVEPDRVRAVVGRGPAGTVALAERLAAGPPVATVPGGTYYLRPDTPLGWLVKAGLVATTGWDSVVMSGEVGLALRGGRPFPDFAPHPPPIQWIPVAAAAVDSACVEQALRLVADIATILAAWEEAPPKLLKTGGVGVRDVRRAATATGRSEIEAARLMELAAVAALAGWDGAQDYARPRPAYDEWLSQDGAERWGILIGAWLASAVHLNLAGAIGTNQKPIPPLLDRWPEESAPERRRLVLAALASGDRGQAAELSSLVKRVHWDAPSVWDGGPTTPAALARWVREEAEMIGVLADGALSDLGRLVVAGDLSAAVAYLSAHSAPIVSEFVIQADLTVVATGQLPPAVRADLELLADLESAGVATVYRFSEPSLRRAFDVGWTATEIIGFLSAHASRGVPQPLSYLVEDMDRRHGRVRVGTASCYLRSDDTALLAEIMASRRAAKLDLQQLAPTVLASSLGPEAVVDVLRAIGYLPAVEDRTGAVVITRPERRRAAHGHPDPAHGHADPAWRGPWAGSGGARGSRPPDLTTLVRRLRKPAPSPPKSQKPAPSPRSISRAAPLAPITPLRPGLPSFDGLPDAPERPTEIAATWGTITELLSLARDEDYLVRLEYVDSRGRTSQVNAAVLEFAGAGVVLAVMPKFKPLAMTVGRIRWARMLTEAEEELL
jgi:hypothetical protein